MNTLKRNTGFTLIEVLVTVLVLAIGLLGLAGLQLTALRNNTTAYERSQATILAYDIIDRMRANRSSALAGNYDTALGDAPTNTDCRGTSANCSPSQLAAFDLNQWKCNLGGWISNASCTGLGLTDPKLSNGDGSVVVNGNTVTVTIRWEENRGAEAAADKLTSLSINTVI